jgi:hypothetical protein
VPQESTTQSWSQVGSSRVLEPSSRVRQPCLRQGRSEAARCHRTWSSFRSFSLAIRPPNRGRRRVTATCHSPRANIDPAVFAVADVVTVTCEKRDALGSHENARDLQVSRRDDSQDLVFAFEGISTTEKGATVTAPVTEHVTAAFRVAQTRTPARVSRWRSCVFLGAPGEIRTPDPQVRSLVLYPTELRARSRELWLCAKGPSSPCPSPAAFIRSRNTAARPR